MQQLWDEEAGVWKSKHPVHLDELPSPLLVFGYGSLLWKVDPIFERFRCFPAIAIGYRRVFAQLSMDHRGTPQAPGLVCTLISDNEHAEANGREPPHQPSRTVGLVYEIPRHQAVEIIEALDYREKGGYTRHIIDVELLEHIGLHSDGRTGRVVAKAVVYKGLVSNPNFRYLPPEQAAAIIAHARGPSGRNCEYLFELCHYVRAVGAQADEPELMELESYVRQHVPEHSLHPHEYALLTWGSNQYGQLPLVDVQEQSNSAVVSDFDSIGVAASRVAQVHCGGMHTGILLKGGKLLLFGSEAPSEQAETAPNMRYISPKLNVSKVALGHAHALLVTASKRLFGIGDDSHGQVSGCGVSSVVQDGWRELRLSGGEQPKVMSIAAGVMHSAAVTEGGEVYTWGTSKHGVCLSAGSMPWKPSDAELVGVQCGQKHTLLHDSLQRVWSIGSTNWGQLGRPINGGDDASGARSDSTPAVVQLPGPSGERRILSVACGWSHSVVVYSIEGTTCLAGWGRVDLGQLPGIDSETRSVSEPVLLQAPPTEDAVSYVACGSEYTTAVTEQGVVYACGWNEHGNLCTGDTVDVRTWQRVSLPEGHRVAKLACGGAHCIALTAVCKTDGSDTSRDGQILN